MTRCPLKDSRTDHYVETAAGGRAIVDKGRSSLLPFNTTTPVPRSRTVRCWHTEPQVIKGSFFMAKSDKRKTWAAAKGKYAKELKGVKFKSDLGPSLDKLYTQYNKPLKTFSDLDAKEMDEKTAELAKKCQPIIREYLDKVDGITDEDAKSGLKKILNEIKTDVDKLANLA